MKFIEEKEMKHLAKKYYPKGLIENAMNQKQLMVAINGSILKEEKKPLLIYLNHIHHQRVRKTPELKRLLNQLLLANESIEVKNKAQELLNGKQTIKVKNKESSYVYLIRENISNTIKIGYTNNPERRVAEFRVQLPFEINHIHTIQCVNGRETEKLLHKLYQHKRVNGEWFRLSELDVGDIKKLNLPRRIIAMVTGENIDSYLNKQKKRTKKRGNKKVENSTIKEPKNVPTFDDDDYLIFEEDYDEFRCDPSLETYDESDSHFCGERDFCNQYCHESCYYERT